ncbi:MAG: RDD family protein [Rheinheimera sp.]|nr:RDD family protein [Rheinheimera sp.]
MSKEETTMPLDQQQDVAGIAQPSAVAAASDDTPANARLAGQPASRKDRFLGSLIDLVLQVLASAPFFWYMGLESFQNPTPALMLANSANALLVYLALHGYLLHKYGQTIGKAEFGMRIEMLNGQKASLQHIVLWRYLPVILMSFVPVIGQWLTGLLDPLLIFRKDRRCLHDHIAGTQVHYCYRADEPRTETATPVEPAATTSAEMNQQS